MHIAEQVAAMSAITRGRRFLQTREEKEGFVFIGVWN